MIDEEYGVDSIELHCIDDKVEYYLLMIVVVEEDV